MSKEIYHLFQELIPELASQALPDDLTDFCVFRDWLNQEYSYLQYVEIKEFDDNGIEDSHIFQQNNVDTTALQQHIADQVEDYISSFDEDEAEDFDLDQRIEIEDRIEEILFEEIKTVALQHGLQLFVVIRENPYWMVLPQQSDSVTEQVLTVFDKSFSENWDLNLVAY